MIFENNSEQNDYIHEQLRKYNRQYINNFKDYNFHIKENPNDLDSKIIAGIVARSTFDTLEIEFLHVDEKYRHKGYGKELLMYAEKLAKENNLKRILLNTYSFQAPYFYKKLGYTELFKVNPCFDKYSQHFFIKYL